MNTKYRLFGSKNISTYFILIPQMNNNYMAQGLKIVLSY